MTRKDYIATAGAIRRFLSLFRRAAPFSAAQWAHHYFGGFEQ